MVGSQRHSLPSDRPADRQAEQHDTEFRVHPDIPAWAAPIAVPADRVDRGLPRPGTQRSPLLPLGGGPGTGHRAYVRE